MTSALQNCNTLSQTTSSIDQRSDSKHLSNLRKSIEIIHREKPGDRPNAGRNKKKLENECNFEFFVTISGELNHLFLKTKWCIFVTQVLLVENHPTISKRANYY
jgi:hypothetical protein